jgi:EmrB/QacA subfamily drug resistance transporter
MLIAFRVLQGLGGGFVLPVAMAYTYRLAPPERVGSVMGMMGIPILFAPAIGPVLAGWLVDDASWRWVFLLNLPVGIIGVLVGLRSLPVLARQQTPVLDLLGTILAPLAFASLVYGVSEGSTSWTSINTIVGLAVGTVALIAFIIVELRVEHPLLELRVFRAPDFDIAIVTQWILQFALFGSLFLVPQFLESVRGYSALDTGLSLLPQAIGAAIFMPLGGALFDRIGARPLLVSGSVLMVIAGFMLAQVGIHTDGRDLIVPLFLYGVGMGLSFMSLNTQVINAAPRSLVGRVTALTNAFQQVVNALTIALLTTFLTSRPSYKAAQLMLAQATAQAAKAGHAAGHAVAAAHGALPAPIAALFSHAFGDTFTFMAIMAVVAGVLGLGLRRKTAAQREAEAAGDTAAEPVPQMMAG